MWTFSRDGEWKKEKKTEKKKLGDTLSQSSILGSLSDHRVLAENKPTETQRASFQWEGILKRDAARRIKAQMVQKSIQWSPLTPRRGAPLRWNRSDKETLCGAAERARGNMKP